MDRSNFSRFWDAFPGSFQPNSTTYYQPTSSVRHSLIHVRLFIWILPKRFLNIASRFRTWQRECRILLTLSNTTNTQTSHTQTHELAQVQQTNYTDKWVSLQQDCVPFTAQCERNDALQSIPPSLEIWKYELLMLLQFSETMQLPSFNCVDKSEYEECRTECEQVYMNRIQSKGTNKVISVCSSVSQWTTNSDFRVSRWVHPCQLFWKPNCPGHV